MATTSTQARGVIYIHSAPRALCPHLEWAGRALGRAVNLEWADQPVLAGSRAEFYWEGPAGTGAALATAIRGMGAPAVRGERRPTARSDGGRWMHTPDLGIHYAQTDTAGNVVIGEDRIRYAMEIAAGDPCDLQRELQVALGSHVGRRARTVPPRQRRRFRRVAAQGGLRPTTSTSDGSRRQYRLRTASRRPRPRIPV
jgi:hypothetical protein